MARKTLLTEGEIRQFMKLASLPAVGNARLTEFVGPTETETGEEDSLEEMDVPVDDEEVGPEGAEDLAGEEEELGMDADLDADVEVDADVDAEELVTRIAHDLEALARMAGVDVDVEDDAPDGEDDLELDAELGPVEDPEADMALGGEEEDLEPMMEDEDIVNEVASRIAARLRAKESKDERVSNLAERILNRITNAK
jgi:hypothetical protein